MSRFGLIRHGRVISGGGGGGVNTILLGFNIAGTNYYSPNLVNTDLAQMGGNDGGIITMPSGAEIPSANLNSAGQVVSLPGSDTKWRLTFNPPEHATQVNVSWSPASAVSAATAGPGGTINSLNLAAGTAVVTPQYSLDDVTAGTVSLAQLGWSIDFTPTGTPMTSISALPIGQSSGLTTNFTAQVNQMSQAGATLRTLDRNDVNKNQGFFQWAQSSSRVNFPSSGIITAANRTTLNSPDWTPNNGQRVGEPDVFASRKIDGEPWEVAIARANATGRYYYRNLPWNCDTTYLQAFADYVCANATGPVFVEVSNEVWNTGFQVNTQARSEAYGNLNFMDSGTVADPGASAHTPSNLITSPYAIQSTTTTDPVTSVVISDSNAGAAERYCEKSCQFFKILKDRCTANGKPNAIKYVLAWQNTSAATIATMLDYIPNKNGVATQDGLATKAHVDYVASAPYFLQGSLTYYQAPDMTVLSNALKDDIDNVTDIAQAIAAVATARGLGYLTYEGGDSIYFHPLQVTCGTTANTALSGGTAFPTFDGHATGSGETVLLKNQTASAQNGVYVVGGTSTAWTLTRHSTMNAWSLFPGANVWVQNGTTLANTTWICTAAATGTVDTTAVTFVRSTNAGTTDQSFYATGDTTTPAAVQISRNAIMYDCYMYWLDRLNKKLPSGSIVNKYFNCGGVSGTVGAWGSLEMSTDMEMTAAALKTNRPKAAAIRDFIAGSRKLQPLIGSSFAGLNATVGTIVGSYKRRTYGSTVSLTGTAATALAFVDATAAVLQLKVADASFFTSAGTITGNLVETDSRDASGSNSTAISCPVISTPIWSVSASSSYYTISNSGVTGALTGNASVDNLLVANQSASLTDKWFDVTIDSLSGNMTVGLTAPGTPATGSQPYVKYYSGGAFVDNTGSVFASGLATFSAGDKIRIRIKSNNVFYAAKWNGSAWVWQNGANPDANTGGSTITGLDSTFLPCVDITGFPSQVTADFTGW